jgi:N-acetyl sugar amidotransferase
MIMVDVQQCSVCVLDDKVLQLTFDDAGQCDACKAAMARLKTMYQHPDQDSTALQALAVNLRRAGQGKPYDAMVGLSGGIDSAYLAHLAVKTMGLRVLAVHVDGGWNSYAAVRNIERIVRTLDIDLYTHVVEWQEMADLQTAFLKAGVFNQDIPQDHAFFSTLYLLAKRFGINSFLSGVNSATESVSPKHTSASYIDDLYIRSIHRKHGNRRLKHYRVMNFWSYLLQTKLFKRPEVMMPLDMINYDKTLAKALLTSDYGWIDYGEKHTESRFTKFYQEVYLPQRFGHDKRSLHLSSLIVSGHTTRADALKVLATPICDADNIRRQTRFVAKKLGWATGDLQTLLVAPANHVDTYPNRKNLFAWIFAARSVLKKFWRPKRSIHSAERTSV